MSTAQVFSVSELVWGKVEPYPWWPGRIVQIVRQNHQQIYKISFFAETAYAYLLSHQLIAYQSFDPALNSQYAENSLQKKAVQMAENYFNKIKLASSAKSNSGSMQQDCQQVAMPLKEHCVEKEEVGTQNLVLPEAQKAVEEGLQSKTTPSLETCPMADEVEGDNLFLLLENNGKKQKKSNYSYELRKEEIRYQDKLKEALLKRYNLLSIGRQSESPSKIKHPKTIIQITPPLPSHRKTTKKIQKNKSAHSVSNTEISVLRVHCLRKLTHFLNNSQDSSSTIKHHSLQILNRILLLSDNNHMKLKSLFVTLVKTVGRCAANMNCEQKSSQFRQYLERMENEKHEDEEGSRLTQIETLMN